jgi:hypothetical protein
LLSCQRGLKLLRHALAEGVTPTERQNFLSKALNAVKQERRSYVIAPHSRPKNNVVSRLTGAQQLLFGDNRQGTKVVKLSAVEQAALADREEEQAFEAQGGVVETDDQGTRTWSINGQRHRENGPAVEGTDGTKEWWLNGQRHRGDGPAIVWNNGAKMWYQNGQHCSLLKQKLMEAQYGSN